MKEKARKGLLTIWSDVDPDDRVEFQKWHTCEHIMERVSIPGFSVGRRYRGVGDAPDFLMCYETDDSHVLSSEPYLHAVNHPSPWTREVIRHSKKHRKGNLQHGCLSRRTAADGSPLRCSFEIQY